MNLIARVKAAREAAVPLLAVTTPDPAACIQSIREGLSNGSPAPLPFFRWDAANGLVPLNSSAAEALAALGLSGDDLVNATLVLTDCLKLAVQLPGERQDAEDKVIVRGSIVFVLNAHRFLAPDVQGSATATQAVWNLRDLFKQDRRTCILLAPQLTLPLELQQDVILLDEAFPDEEELAKIVSDQVSLNADELARAVDAVRGAGSAFTVEQITAMSLRFETEPPTLDLEELWERKRSMIEQTPGLGISRFKGSLADMGGNENARRYGLAVLGGRRKIRTVVHWDEIEKSFGGLGTTGGPGDNTGVSQDALQVWLKALEDYDWLMLLAVGVPGSGKTLFARSLGNSVEPRVETITLDAGALKASRVGESEGLIRTCVKTLLSVGGLGGVFFVATCNKLDTLPPEFRRRARRGIMYFDLPTSAERAEIWRINLQKYELNPSSAEMPADENWTGADIRNVCELAWDHEIPLKEAANYIVPVAVSDPESIERLRDQAHRRFLSATQRGLYLRPGKAGALVEAMTGTPVRAVRRGGA